MNYRKAWWLGILLAFAAFLAFILRENFKHEEVSFILLTIAGIVLFAAGAAMRLVYYRCPNCDRLLPSRGFISRYCPRCGNRLSS